MAELLGRMIVAHTDRGEQGGRASSSRVFFPDAPPQIMLPARDSAGFVGLEACAECHREWYDGFVHAAHARPSAEPTSQSFQGPFDVGDNRISTTNPNLYFEMTGEEDGYCQIALERTQYGEQTRSHPSKWPGGVVVVAQIREYHRFCLLTGPSIDIPLEDFIFRPQPAGLGETR